MGARVWSTGIEGFGFLGGFGASHGRGVVVTPGHGMEGLVPWQEEVEGFLQSG